MKELLTNIKFAYQRAVRGYDDRVKLGYGLDGVLEDYLLPLLDFCCRKLSEDYNGEKRKDIFEKTILFILRYRASGIKDHNDKSDEMWKYIGKNMGYYWD